MVPSTVNRLLCRSIAKHMHVIVYSSLAIDIHYNIYGLTRLKRAIYANKFCDFKSAGLEAKLSLYK